MIRAIAIWINWTVLVLFVVSLLATSQLSTVGAVSIVPLLPFGTALATYHFRPRLPLVWVSLALNILLCVVGFFGIVAAFLGMTDSPFVAVVAVLLLLMLPCAFNVRNMLRIRLRLKANHAHNTLNTDRPQTDQADRAKDALRVNGSGGAHEKSNADR